MTNQCRTCEHFTPDRRFPKSGICEAIAHLGAQRETIQKSFEPRNPRVLRNGPDCIAVYVRQPRSRTTFRGLSKEQIRELMYPRAYSSVNPLRRFVRSIF